MKHELSRREVGLALLAGGLAARADVLRAETPPERLIALVLFPDLTLLDLVGPLQVLKSLPAPYRTVVVGERLEPMRSDTGLALAPERRVADRPPPLPAARAGRARAGGPP